MSETRRLSRRELRELGKLEARPADSESIVDHSELDLDRPSRKEMRERHKRAKAEAAAKAKAAEEAKATEEAARVEAEAKAAEEEKAKAEAEAKAKAEAEAKAAEEAARVEAEAKAAEEEKAKAEAEAQAAEETAPEPEQRKSVFDRFEDTEATDPEDSEEPEDAEDEDTGAGDSLHDRLVAMTSQKRDEDAMATMATELGGEVETKPATGVEAEKLPAEATSAELDVEEDSNSTMQYVLTIIVILAIAVVVGYLIGTWINATFLSAGLPEFPGADVASGALTEFFSNLV